MSYAEINRVLGRYFVYLASILLVPLSVAVAYECFIDKIFYFSTPASLAFLETIIICFLSGMLFRWWGRKAKGTLYRKEGILLVVSIWFFTAAIGTCPFLVTKTIRSPVDAYFESMSGLTTTGATILYPKQYDGDKEVPRHRSKPSRSQFGIYFLRHYRTSPRS